VHKHKKKFGQNFLNNHQILEQILEVSEVAANENILEIGPGDGALTTLLLENAKKVTCVEIDRDLEKILVPKFSENKKFNLIMKDVLTLDFEKDISEKVKVVANIPYYITSSIIKKLLENKEYVDEIYIMVQKEVAERIAAKPGTKARSVLTLSIEYFGDAELLFVIPRENFTPVPNVDSAFLKIIPRKNNKYIDMISEKTFFKYVKASFQTKRKNITNNIARLGFNKTELRELLEKNGINHKKRAEEFSIDEFVELIKILEESKG